MISKHSVSPFTLVIAPALAFVVGCGDAASVDAGAAVRDSAGIRITTSTSPAWEGGTGWTVDAMPVVSIGVLDGDSVYQLYRVQDAVRLSDGRIAVGNAGSGEVRFFDREGLWLMSTGRRGRGPGEFEGMYSIFRLRGDTLVVSDVALSRVVLVDPAGQVIGTLSSRLPIGAFADGSFVRGDSGIPEGTDIRAGTLRHQVDLVRFQPGGSDIATLAVLPGNETSMVVEASGGTTGATGYARPFGLTRQFAVSDSLIFTADGASFEITALNRDGNIVRIARIDRPNAVVTESMRTAYRDRFLSRIPEGPYRQRAARVFDTDAFPARLPAIQSMKLDRSGCLWVEQYRDDPAGAPAWDIFDASDRWLGTVRTPAGLRITDIGDDWILGITRDDVDVEHVVIHELRRGQ